MMKRWFLVSMILLLLGLVVGCGIPQEQYDALLAERDRVQAEAVSLQSQVAALKSELDALKSELDTARSDLAATRSELDAAQSQIQTLQDQSMAARNDITTLQVEVRKAQSDCNTLEQQLDQCRQYGEVLEVYFFSPAFTMTGAQVAELSAMLDKLGDAELKEKWAAYVYSGKEEDRMAFYIAVWEGLWGRLVWRLIRT